MPRSKSKPAESPKDAIARLQAEAERYGLTLVVATAAAPAAGPTLVNPPRPARPMEMSPDTAALVAKLRAEVDTGQYKRVPVEEKVEVRVPAPRKLIIDKFAPQCPRCYEKMPRGRRIVTRDRDDNKIEMQEYICHCNDSTYRVLSPVFGPEPDQGEPPSDAH